MTLQDVLASAAEGPVTVSEIAARTGTDAALVVAMIEMLAARGLVSKARLDLTTLCCGSRCGSCLALDGCDLANPSG